MKIIIIGLGSIGETILKSLSGEGHTITIIDEDKRLIERLIEKYDAFGVVGNGASMDVQKEADARNADLVIALTKNDELNVFACLVAKHLGVGHTVARVRNPEYRKQIEQMRDALGISMVVNPERETADEIFNLISLPSVSGVEHFAKGRALLVEVVVREKSVLAGKSLIELGRMLHAKVLVCAVQRWEEVIIPNGKFMIRDGDRIYFTADAKNLSAFLEEVNLVESPLKNVMIVGGGEVGYYLADTLSRKRYAVKLIEKNADTADALAESLNNVTVICGNGTRQDMLIEEGIEAMDAFVALTDVDEGNMIVSMFANRKRVKKTIALIENDALFGMLHEMGIDNTVSPKRIAADRIISYARALSNSIGSNVKTLYRLVGDQVEALEFAAKKPNEIYGKPLKELNIKKDCLIACIIRNHEVIIPDGNAVIEMDDSVVVVTTQKNLDDLSEVFE